MNALTPLGMVSEFPSENQTNDTHLGQVGEEQKDYFVERDGMRFAGTHLLVDLWDARNFADPAHIDQALREAALAAGATILHSHFHHFSPNGGVSGVVVLAESHISIHTWPERDFAAVDIFMCGACDPALSIPVLQRGVSAVSRSTSRRNGAVASPDLVASFRGAMGGRRCGARPSRYARRSLPYLRLIARMRLGTGDRPWPT